MDNAAPNICLNYEKNYYEYRCIITINIFTFPVVMIEPCLKSFHFKIENASVTNECYQATDNNKKLFLQQ